MQGGNFGNFNNWKPEDHAINKMVYDEAHKNGGGSGGGKNKYSGCASVFLVMILVVIVCITLLSI